jgi:hypothetical protein
MIPLSPDFLLPEQNGSVLVQFVYLCVFTFSVNDKRYVPLPVRVHVFARDVLYKGTVNAGERVGIAGHRHREN